MAHRTGSRSTVSVALLSLVSSLCTACGPAVVGQGEQDKGKQQVASEQQKKSAADSGVALVLGVRKDAPPPPPTSPPPRSPHTTPPSYYEPVGAFFFYVETLTSTGPSRYGFIPTVPCIQSGVFKRGMRLVVRFEILDTSTGKRVTDKDGATIKLLLPHGEEIPGRWTIRGSAAAMADSAWMWDTSWDIPPDYPVGSFDYRIAVATKDGRKATFTPPIQKTPTSDTRVRIID